MHHHKTIVEKLVLLFALILTVMLLIGQTGSLINYSLVVSVGLQEPKHIVGALGVAMNKGFAVSDTFIYLPLLLIGLIGMWHRRPWGLFAIFGALAITAYWPIASLFTLFFGRGIPTFHFENYVAYIFLLLPISILSICGLFYLYKSRRKYFT